MPTVAENLSMWNDAQFWSQNGDEWSEAWGGTKLLWITTVLPRIRPFLPARTILEIAPGHGRFTQFLKNYCERLFVVDLSPLCIEACRKRFSGETHINYYANDGKSLAMIADESVDFAFSFDSLVHVEADVLETYAAQLARKLRPEGVGFLHHSNIGCYPRSVALCRRIPERAGDSSWLHLMFRALGRDGGFPLRSYLMSKGVLINTTGLRGNSVTAEKFAAICQRVGLCCIYQERISWAYGRFLIDCLSIFTRKGSSWERSNRVWDNPDFVRDARKVSRLAGQLPPRSTCARARELPRSRQPDVFSA